MNHLNVLGCLVSMHTADQADGRCKAAGDSR
jgi:hypothetical protein